MSLRIPMRVLSVSLFLLALLGAAGAEPRDGIQQWGGDWAGPDLAPYSRDRGRGEIVGQPPVSRPSPDRDVRPPVVPPVTRPPVTPPVSPPPVSVVQPPVQPERFVGSQPLQQLFDSGRLIPTWIGQGRVAGEMIELQLANTTNVPIAINLEPGMVLELADPTLARQFQPIMLESDNTLLVPANGKLTKMLRGYCLDYSLDPPTNGQAFNYRFPADATAWVPAADILKASLTYDAQERVLPVDQQRTIVIQRAIWTALGQTDKEKLYEDILTDAAQSGKSMSKKKARRIADALWKEVERLMEKAQ